MSEKPAQRIQRWDNFSFEELETLNQSLITSGTLAPKTVAGTDWYNRCADLQRQIHLFVTWKQAEGGMSYV